MRVLVAMSGGVDSSVAAALLRDEGHEVAGCTLRLWGGPSDTGCCSVADVDDARRVAQVLGIEHHVFNLAESFERDVVEPYVDGHRAGRTPNPCVECNRSLKFGTLLDRALRLGFDAVATGHHARVLRGDSRCELRRGSDRAKDQSYVLAVLPREALARTLLPVGDYAKSEVRSIAAGLGLRTAFKPDSQDVCFIPRGGRGDFLRTRLEVTTAVVHDTSDATERGTVESAELVTVGQRRGVPRGSDGAPRYVVDVDLEARSVQVASLDDAMVECLELEAGSLNLYGRRRDRLEVLVQTAAHGAVTPGILELFPSPHVELAWRVRPVAPGQLAVFYVPDDEELVVGAGTVARRPRA